MSRVGKKPVEIPKGVQVTLSGASVSVKGPKGELKGSLPPGIKAEIKDGFVQLSIESGIEPGSVGPVFGTARARMHNMVHGAAAGFSKNLEIQGLGFKAELAGQKLTLAIGKSHPVIFEIPKGVALAVDAKKTLLTVSGADKDLVGEVSANIRSLRPPEPYKGTGIRYQGERVRRKAGKTAAGASAGAGGGAKK